MNFLRNISISRSQLFGTLFLVFGIFVLSLLWGRTYTVEEGDTLESIADTASLDVTLIEAANPGVDLTALEPGTELSLPTRYRSETITEFALRGAPDPIVFDVPTRGWMIFIIILFLGTAIVSLIDRWPEVTRYSLLASGIMIVPAVLIIAAADKSTNLVTMLVESMRLATPIAIGAAAGIWSERSGVVNIAIEGMMLTGAGIGFMTFFIIQQYVIAMETTTALFIGVGVAVIAGGLMALLHAWLSITFKTDQIVSGTAVNILAVGITSFLRREVMLSTEAGMNTLPEIRIPLLADIPVFGEVFFNNKPIFYSMFIILILTHVILFYTPWGLRIRAVGEHPKAADTVGINVILIRYSNVVISGMIAGLGGAWFSLETVGSFNDEMTTGRGFIALAAVIFGKWTPAGAFVGALLFGFADALATRFQILDVPVPPQWLQSIPFVTTMIVLAGLVGRAVAPAAVGQPYEK